MSQFYFYKIEKVWETIGIWVSRTKKNPKQLRKIITLREFVIFHSLFALSLCTISLTLPCKLTICSHFMKENDFLEFVSLHDFNKILDYRLDKFLQFTIQWMLLKLRIA